MRAETGTWNRGNTTKNHDDKPAGTRALMHCIFVILLPFQRRNIITLLASSTWSYFYHWRIFEMGSASCSVRGCHNWKKTRELLSQECFINGPLTHSQCRVAQEVILCKSYFYLSPSRICLHTFFQKTLFFFYMVHCCNTPFHAESWMLCFSYGVRCLASVQFLLRVADADNLIFAWCSQSEAQVGKTHLTQLHKTTVMSHYNINKYRLTILRMQSSLQTIYSTK